MRCLRRSTTLRIVAACRFQSNDRKWSPSNSNDLVVDDTDQWINNRIEQAVASGRNGVTNQGADYFRGLAARPELRRMLVEARQMVGNQDAEMLTAHQKSQYMGVLTQKWSAEAAARVSNSFSEERGFRKYTQEGVPTGENYWIEGATLTDPMVPGYVRDEIFEDMRRDRKPNSPASLTPADIGAEATSTDPVGSNEQK